MSDVCCSVVIGHDLPLLRWCLENARARAGIPHDWLVVNWIPAERPEVAGPIEAWCKLEGIKYHPYHGTPKPDPAGDGTPWFLKNLYAAFNRCYSEAETLWVARMASDQFFSQDWLKNLMASAKRYGDRSVYHCWTVESPVAKHSRHDIQDWGSTWQEFDLARFENYAANFSWRYQNQPVIPGDECNLWYFHPTRGAQTRPDGTSWLMTKALFNEFGPMLDCINEEGVSGDVGIHDRMTDAGVKQYLVMNSINYHLVRAESRSIQQ